MNYYTYGERQLLWAVYYQDIVRFRTAVRNYARNGQLFLLGPPSFRQVTLIEYCIYDDFAQGVGFLTRGRAFDMRLAMEAACSLQGRDGIIDALLQKSFEQRRNFCENLFVLLDHNKHERAQVFVDRPGFDVNENTFMVPGEYLNSDAERAGQTPLHVAVMFDRPGIMGSLIAYGARVNAPDAEGYTPLFIACLRGNYDSVLLLLRHGANLTSQVNANQNLRSPLFATCHLSALSVRNDEIVDLLIQTGLDASQERWVSNNRPFVTDKVYKDLIKARKNTSELRNLCIGATRDALIRSTHGRTMIDNVEKLPLPKAMKQELAFKSPEPSDDESE